MCVGGSVHTCDTVHVTCWGLIMDTSAIIMREGLSACPAPPPEASVSWLVEKYHTPTDSRPPLPPLPLPDASHPHHSHAAMALYTSA